MYFKNKTILNGWHTLRSDLECENSLEILSVARNKHTLLSPELNLIWACRTKKGARFTCCQTSHDLALVEPGPILKSAKDNQKSRSEKCHRRTPKADWLLCGADSAEKSLSGAHYFAVNIASIHRWEVSAFLSSLLLKTSIFLSQSPLTLSVHSTENYYRVLMLKVKQKVRLS